MIVICFFLGGGGEGLNLGSGTKMLIISCSEVRQVSISSITIPLRIPGDLHQKFDPTLGLLHPSFCRGGGFVGIAPEGQVFVYKRFLPFLEFPL